MEWLIAVTIYFLVLGFVLCWNHKISIMNEEYDKDTEKWYRERINEKGDK